MSVFEIGTQVNLLITSYLLDQDAVRYATTNKHFHEYIQKSYVCKEYHHAALFTHGKPAVIINKINGVTSLDQIKCFKENITHLQFEEDVQALHFDSENSEYPVKFSEIIFGLASFTKLTHVGFGRDFRQAQEILQQSTVEIHFQCQGKAEKIKNYAFKSLKFEFPSDPNVERCVENIASLKFGSYLNYKVDQLLNLTPNLTHLSFGAFYDQAINNLPVLERLTQLTFGNNFNKPIDCLTTQPNLTCLSLGDSFNRPISKLPQTITNLKFGRHYNQAVDNLEALTNITHLTFDTFFNQNVDCLASLSKLTHLTFGTFFNQPMENLLSGTHKLIHLTFGAKFNQPLINIPQSLRQLIISDEFDHLLPSNIQIITCSSKLNTDKPCVVS